MSGTQTPQEEFNERAVEHSAAFLTVPHLAVVQNLRQLWADARQRTIDSHTAEM